MKGRRGEVTILITDIKGFTAYSETKNPEEVVEALNEYFAIATKYILEYGGYVDKFIGDAVLAVFGGCRQMTAMDNKGMVNLKYLLSISVYLFLLLVVMVFGCAPRIVPRAGEQTFPDFVAVVVQEGDTLSSLSTKHLNDPSMDWIIAEYNDIETLKPGQGLIVPLKPYARGGLTVKGYQTVPVLSYHNFSLTESNKMTVTQEAFEEQMKLLRDKGYRVITLDQLFDFLEFKKQIPKKSVVITIDVGWRSTYEIAMPILKKYGYPATLFVYTDLIVGSWKALSWDLAKELENNGIDVQCHTKTHRNLTIMNEKESFTEYFENLEKELSECAAIVKKKLNKDVKYLAYPYGDTNHLIIELMRKQGYRGAFTVERGSNPFFIHNYKVHRSMIYGDYSLDQFEKNLTFFYGEALE